jgi:hypothetical protein
VNVEVKPDLPEALRVTCERNQYAGDCTEVELQVQEWVVAVCVGVNEKGKKKVEVVEVGGRDIFTTPAIDIEQ